MNCMRPASYCEQLLQVFAGLLGDVVKPPTSEPPDRLMTGSVIALPSGFLPVMLILTTELLDGDSIFMWLLVLLSEMASKLYAFVMVGSADAVSTSVTFGISIYGRLKGVESVFFSVTTLPLTLQFAAVRPRFAHVEAPPSETGPIIDDGAGMGGVGSWTSCGRWIIEPWAKVREHPVHAVTLPVVQLPTPV